MKLSNLLLSLFVFNGLHDVVSQQRGSSKAVRGSSSLRSETARMLMGEDKGDDGDAGDGGDDGGDKKGGKDDKKGDDGGDDGDKKGGKGAKGDKGDKGGKGDSGGDTGSDGGGSVEGDYTISHAGVMERHRCIDYSSVSDQKKTDVRNTGECSTNNCAKGCCRDYQFLVCDEDNDFPDLACICNENTYFHSSGTDDEDKEGDGEEPVPVPPVAPPTYAPGEDPVDECTDAYWGYGFGQVPPVEAVGLQDGMVQGDCLRSSHCAQTAGECCLKFMCICGSSNEPDEHCMPW